jgi:PIN domain nuclease of toxin-antitoxin system
MKRPRRSGAAAGSAAAHLLDTSTLLWALGSPERLSSRARRLVEIGENVVSIASYWEVVVKTQKGLLTIADLPTWWQRATELVAGRTLPIRASHVTALVTLPALHKDPFDRILIAQAITEGLAFVTNDEHIKAYPLRTIW